jgi:3-oxoacyl-[acyl-carrier-protein] synthase II
MLIRAGRADVVVAGGTEAGLTELGLAGFCSMRALATNFNDEPEKASRPFDALRDGFVPSEGAGVLIIESEEHAKARGAAIHAELAGFGCTNDAFHIVAPPEDGEGARRAMELSLEDAGLAIDDVDYISAHATSTQLGDAAETKAIKALFGERAYEIPVSAAKSMLGHGIAASGAFESVAVVRTIEANRVHPTINLENPDPECDLDYVSEGARDVQVDVVLKNSFGFGGQNSCLVIQRYEG